MHTLQTQESPSQESPSQEWAPGSDASPGEFSCIHIGLPKTATCTLQRHLFLHHSQIHFLGKFRRGKSPDRATENFLAQVFENRLGARRLSALRRWVDDRCRDDKRRGAIPLLSDEAFSSGDIDTHIWRARNLRESLGPCKVIFFLRQPVHLMRSLYRHTLKCRHVGSSSTYARAPRYSSCGQWFENHSDWNRGPLTFLNYAETLQVYADVFGRQNIKLTLFEQFAEDNEAVIRDICEFLGIEPAEALQILNGKHENKHLTLPQIDRLREIEGSFWQSFAFRFSPRKRRKRMIFEQPPATRVTPEEDLEVPPAWQEKICDFTREGNREIARQWNLPLEQYNYPV